MNGTGFGNFVALDEADAPQLLQRMSNQQLRVDGQRYGIETRLIARPGAEITDLASATLRKLFSTCDISPNCVGGLVLSSRIVGVQEAADNVARSVGLDGEAHGVECACSGFPAAVARGMRLCQRLEKPIAVVTSEIISSSINWESGSGQLSDHRRACGQAAPIFADGAAGVLILPPSWQPQHLILDCWVDEIPDDKQLIQKIEVGDSVDPWGRTRSQVTTCLGMPGRRGLLLLRRAPQILLEALKRSLTSAQAAGLIDAEAPSHIVPHQANGRITSKLKQLAQQSWDPPARVWNCIQYAGNTVSASIPTAMASVQRQLPQDALIGMPSVGAGGPGYRPDVLSLGCVLTRTRSAK